MGSEPIEVRSFLLIGVFAYIVDIIGHRASFIDALEIFVETSVPNFL